jgi:histidinol-phosphate/aromatic aminotransferase/cobyric acid decarboxylase-like protein
MTRWEALVRFDDEIREAAMKLIPFGWEWVEQLGEAFFALNEDRKYLANIVARLTEEAERLAVQAKHAAALAWVATFTTTADGEETSEEALAILIEAQAIGYQLAEDCDGTIRITRNTSTSFLRSNTDIVRFGTFFRGAASS